MTNVVTLSAHPAKTYPKLWIRQRQVAVFLTFRYAHKDRAEHWTQKYTTHILLVSPRWCHALCTLYLQRFFAKSRHIETLQPEVKETPFFHSHIWLENPFSLREHHVGSTFVSSDALVAWVHISDKGSTGVHTTSLQKCADGSWHLTNNCRRRSSWCTGPKGRERQRMSAITYHIQAQHINVSLQKCSSSKNQPKDIYWAEKAVWHKAVWQD